MTGEPVIAFGQQPCGFFPRRFLVAKIRTARRLQAEMGGRIVFFCHDSDHDPRETRTILRHRTTGETAKLNFEVASKLQRKFSPLYAKRIAPGWQARRRSAGSLESTTSIPSSQPRRRYMARQKSATVSADVFRNTSITRPSR